MEIFYRLRAVFVILVFIMTVGYKWLCYGRRACQ